MKKEFRIKKLSEIRGEHVEPYMTGIRIRYQGEIKPFAAYKIPLKHLIYNKYNGRIGSLIKSYEKQRHILDAEKDQDARLIERFLWESKESRNRTTMNSLVHDGQKQWGIVTNDGIIIDGNRRAMLLNRIYRERELYKTNVDHAQYFIAVILPEGADPKEVSRLETTYQMGEDEKLDYNPIEKYLKCKDLKEIYKFSEDDIAEMMGETPPRIREWLQIMELMDDYLAYLGYDGIYTRLEKREGQFVNLEQYLRGYKNGSTAVDWPYDKELDVLDLKMICFDYIRAQWEGKEFRDIARPSKKEGIFCKQDIWESFRKSHFDKVEPITDNEKPTEDWRKENPEADLTVLLETRDTEWSKRAEAGLKGNLFKAVRENELLNQANEPVELIGRAIEAIQKIDTDVDTFYTQEVDDLLKKLNSMAYDYRKMIKRNRQK